MVCGMWHVLEKVQASFMEIDLAPTLQHGPLSKGLD